MASHAASNGTYEAPRIHTDLQDTGVAVSRKKVAGLMRDKDIEGISPRSWHPPTVLASTHGPGIHPRPSTGITRSPSRTPSNGSSTQEIRTGPGSPTPPNLHTGEGWAYLCVVRDGHTHRILDRTVGDSLHTDLVEDTLQQAVALRGALPRKVVFHADQGNQHTSSQLTDTAAELGVLRSMGHTGMCWDNTAAESF